MEQKKRVPSLIEPNKDSPFRILDVRSINDNVPTSSHTGQQVNASELSDDSSDSEKELVIDMADPEEPDYEDYNANPVQVPMLAQELEIESKMITPQTPATPPKTVPKSRTNRRKSQLVRMEDADVTFDAPVKHPPKQVDDVLQEGIEANRHIMRHIALLRTTINCLVEARYHRSIPFPKDTSDFETMDSWMDMYEQMKWETNDTKSSKAKAAKKS